MRQRTKINVPEPKGSEFENFDRLAGIIMQVPAKKKPAKPAKPAKSKK